MTKPSPFRQQMQAAFKRAEKAIKTAAAEERFLIGSWNEKRLKRALATMGLQRLADKTLLAPAVHRRHAKSLAERFVKKWQAVKGAASRRSRQGEGVSAQRQVRFLTVLHSVERLNVDEALRASEELARKLVSAVHDSPGTWLLGALEVEVISMRFMREIAAQRESVGSEMRKLDVCEFLLQQLPKKRQAEPTLALVHFHGVLFATDETRFLSLGRNLETFCGNGASRQIQMKPLSDSYSGKPKSVVKNLTDIARYITKGGNDWMGNKAYLRYKIGFDNEDVQSEDAWVQKNWRRNETLKRERIEDGLVDGLSMTNSEVAFLTEVIDSLMGRVRNRTGYLVFARSAKKSRLAVSRRS